MKQYNKFIAYRERIIVRFGAVSKNRGFCSWTEL